MSLIPEPPQIYRSGAWRRGGITVEPVWVRWQGTDVQVYTGNGGLVAEFNAWDDLPPSDPYCVLENEFAVVGASYMAETQYDQMDVGSFVESIEAERTDPWTFLVNNELFYIQARGKNGYAQGVFQHAFQHPDGSWYGHNTTSFSGQTGAVVDIFVAKINIDSGQVTMAKKVCMEMTYTLNHMALLSTGAVFNYDMSVTISAVDNFLAGQTGLSASHFRTAHSGNASWTVNSSNWDSTASGSLEASKSNSYFMGGLPRGANVNNTGHYGNGWASPDQPTLDWNDRDETWKRRWVYYYPNAESFISSEMIRWGHTHRAEEENRTPQVAWVGGFINSPCWSGIDTINGVVSSTFDNTRDITGSSSVYSECLVEVSSFDPSLGNIAGIGRSEFSGGYGSLLLDNESDVDYEMDSVSETLKAAIEGPPRATNCGASAHDYDGAGHELIDDRSNFYGYFALPQNWLDPPTETRPETSDPQYFWSNLEGAKFHMPNALTSANEGEARMHYRISV